jgi:signal transduction histidine kinase/tetratricopeptide (TPR) repeat protein
LKHLYFLFLIFNLISLKLLAGNQNPKVDSLKRLIKPALAYPSQHSDTLTINRLNTLAGDLYESAPDSTAYFSGLALEFAKKNGYKKGMADAYVQLASVYTFRGNYTGAAINFNNALANYQQQNNKTGISACYIGLGQIQDYLGNYDAAIVFFNKALAIRKVISKGVLLADCYAAIGITYDNKGEFSKALDAYFRALTIDIKYKNDLAAADNYCNIGVIMQHLQLYPKALNYYNQALAIWIKLNDKQGLSTVWQNIGEILMAQKKYAAAIGYFNKASAVFHQLGDKEGLSLVYYDLGLYNYYTGHPDSALVYLNRSLQSASQYKIKYNKAYAYLGLAMVYNLEKKYALAYANAVLAQNTANTLGSLNTKVDATLQVSKALAGLQRYEEAYNQHQLHEALKDSLKNNENIEKIIVYNLEVEFGKRQKEIDLKYEKSLVLQQRAIAIGAIAIIVLLAMTIVYLKAKNKQQKINNILINKNEEILTQKNSLDTQADKLHELNNLKDRLIAVLAHDLRAPLSTLRGLFALMADESITHNEFVTMIPQVFNKLEHTSDFLDTLLSWINSQVDHAPETLVQVNLNDTVKQELIYVSELMERKNIAPIIDIAPDAIVLAEPGSVRIVIHNFLTNAVKFSPRNSQVTIAAARQNNEVYLTVTDHGAGIKPELLDTLFKNRVTSALGTENESGTGMGLYFCKDLIEKYHGTIWAKNTENGTELGFKLPA